MRVWCVGVPQWGHVGEAQVLDGQARWQLLLICGGPAV